MKPALLATLLILSYVRPAGAQLAFEGLPPSTSVAQSQHDKGERVRRIVEAFASEPLAAPPIPPKVGLDEFADRMIARMILKKDLAAVSKNLMTPDFKPWNPGTEMSLISKDICHRMGDYDFVLQSLLRMAYLDDAGHLLTPEARHKLRYELLSQVGNVHHVKFSFDDCIKFKITDSENHILMTNISQYLTNQLRFADTGRPEFDNEKNGNNAWMLNHLSQFLRNDFSELNSKPYQGYTLITVANLYSYARDPRVKSAAQMILDYLSTKIALQSNGLRRRVPIRRQKLHRDDDTLMADDSAMTFMTADTGNYEYLALEPNNSVKLTYNDHRYTLLMGATDDYDVPSMILDYFVSPTPQYQRFHGRDVEVYAPSKSFLIGGGGRFRAQFGFFSGQNDEYAVSTIVIPAHEALLRSQMFYIDGPSDWHKKNNLCVAPGFACGENFHAPVSPTAVSGNWSFYDTKDFYLAAFQQASFVMIEVRERDIAFEAFKSQVLSANASLSLAKHSLSTYQLSTGHSVTFTPTTGDLDTFPIAALDGVAMDRDTTKWPYLQGSVMTSKGDGLIVIENKRLRERMILDDRDIMNPVRRVESY